MSELPQIGSYLFHGLRVSVSGDGPAPHFLHSRLTPFTTAGPGETDVTVEFRCVPPGGRHSVERPRGPERRIYETSVADILYHADTDELYIEYNGGARALCDPARRRLSFSMVASEKNAWYASHPLFTVCWIELLKRLRLFSIHASGVCRGGKGLLIAGTSGAGKTTLAMALFKQGLEFLGDDMLFLRDGPAGLRVLSFPDETDVTGDTIAMFPELAPAGGFTGTAERPKLAIRPETVYEAPVAFECEPAILVFPRVVRDEPCALQAIGAGDALLELAPNVLLTQQRASQAHLTILGKLASQTACYRMSVGRPEDAARMLAELLAGLPDV